MARYTFGGTAQDGVYTTFDFGGRRLLALADATLTFWSAKTGGVQYTDLLDANGQAVASIKVTGGQVPTFQGPDTITQMWVDDGDSERHLLVNRQTGPQGPSGPGGSDADVGGYINTPGSVSRAAVDARVDVHVTDAGDAHDASAISFVPGGNLASTDVQSAIAELEAEKASSGHTHADADPWHTIGGAGEPTFAAGWSNATAGVPAGTPSAGFRKDSANNLHLRGYVAGTSGSPVLTLPAGYRPSGTVSKATLHAGSTQGSAMIRIDTAGVVTIFLITGTAPTGGFGYYFEATVNLT